MAGVLLASGKILRAVSVARLQCSAMGGNARRVIGKREIVGFGFNGEPNYADRPDFPMPAVRWREPSPEIIALREKEKGDWNCLTVEEKKALYRASFCQTYAEFQTSMNEWKSIIGITCFLVAVAFWIFYFLKACVYRPLPDSFSEESRRAQLRRIIDLQANPIRGIASQWDYEKDDWKK